MSKTLPNPGTYEARRKSPIVVRAEESGSLMAYIPYALIGVDYAGNHAVCIGAKSGQLQVNNIKNLQAAFGWDGLNPFDLETIPLREDESAEFELADCFHEEYTPKPTEENPDPQPVMTFKAQWFNKLGGGISREPMSELERKDVLTKWGSKFKAIAGKPANATAKAQPATAASKPAETPKPAAKSSGPPSRGKVEPKVAPSTDGEVWDKICEKNDGKPEAELQAIFWEVQDAALGKGEDGRKLTAEEWGKVMAHVEAN